MVHGRCGLSAGRPQSQWHTGVWPVGREATQPVAPDKRVRKETCEPSQLQQNKTRQKTTGRLVERSEINEVVPPADVF